VSDGPVAPGEDVLGGGVGPVVHDGVVVSAEVPVDVGIEWQVLPASLHLEGDLPLDGRKADDGEGDPLADVVGVAVHAAQERGAHGARALALGAVHPVVDEQRVLIAKERLEADGIGTSHAASFTDELIVALHLAARRQGATLGGDARDMAVELDLLDQQGLAGLAVFGTLVRLAGAVFLSDRSGGLQGGTVGHDLVSQFKPRKLAARLRVPPGMTILRGRPGRTPLILGVQIPELPGVHTIAIIPDNVPTLVRLLSVTALGHVWTSGNRGSGTHPPIMPRSERCCSVVRTSEATQ
jgi:hypothetical protein